MELNGDAAVSSDRLRGQALDVLGLGAFWAWGTLAATSGGAEIQAPLLGQVDSFEFNMAVKCVFALACLLFPQAATRCVASSRRVPLGTVALGCGGTLACMVGAPVSVFLGSAVVAVASACLLFWLLLQTAGQPGDATARLVCSMLASFVVVMAANSAPQPFTQVLCMVLPAVSYACASAPHVGSGPDANGGKADRQQGAATPAHPAAPAWGSSEERRSFVFLGVAASLPVAFFRLSLGLGLGLGSAKWTYVIVLSLCVVALYLAVPMLAHRLDARRVTDGIAVCLLFMLVGVLLVIPKSEAYASIVAGALIYAGDHLCLAYLYGAALTMRTRPGRETRPFSLTLVTTTASWLVGDALGRCVADGGASSGAYAATAICLMLFAAGLFALPRLQRLNDDVGSTTLAELTRLHEELGTYAQERYGLTGRESEVYALAARGFNARMIADELCLSPNTVKSHLDHVYKKCGFHTQEELIRDAFHNRP